MAEGILLGCVGVAAWLIAVWWVVTFRGRNVKDAATRLSLSFLWCILAGLCWIPFQRHTQLDYRTSLMLYASGGLCFIAFGSVVAGSLFRGDLPRLGEGTARKNRWVSRVCITLLVLAGAWHLSVSAISRHNAWLTNTYDLGIMDQTLWNTAHGRLLTYSIDKSRPEARWRNGRVELMYLPIAMLYHLYSDPRTALFAQALLVALGVIPVFLISKEKLGNDLSALVLGLVYLLHPAIQGVCLASIHGNTLAVPFLLFAFYSLEKGNRAGFLVHGALALACREDVASVLAFMGLYAYLRKREQAGLWVFVGSVLWFGAALYALPRFFGHSTGLAGEVAGREMLGHLRTGMLGMLKEMAVNPASFVPELFSRENAFYLFELLVPLAFLPLLCPDLLLTIVPTLCLHLMSGWVLMKNIQTQYPATFLPTLFVGGICGLGHLSGKGIKQGTGGTETTALHSPRLSPTLAIYLLVSSVFLHRTFAVPQVTRGFWDERHIAAMQRSVDFIPLNASVASTQHLGPRLTQREAFYDIQKKNTPDFRVLDTHEPLLWERVSEKQPIYLMDPYDLPAMEEEDYGAIRNLDGVVTFQRGVSPQSGLKTLFVGQPQGPIAPRAVGNAFELVSARLTPRKASSGGFIEVSLFWRLRIPVDRYPFHRLVCETGRDIVYWDRIPTFGRLPLGLWPTKSRSGDATAVMDRLYVRLNTKDPAGRYRFFIDRHVPSTSRTGHLMQLTKTLLYLGQVGTGSHVVSKEAAK